MQRTPATDDEQMVVVGQQVHGLKLRLNQSACSLVGASAPPLTQGHTRLSQQRLQRHKTHHTAIIHSLSCL